MNRLLSTLLVLIPTALSLACSEDSGGGAGGDAGGSGDAADGSGGASTGSGGASTGSGGASTGSGGASTGSGGAAGGAGGSGTGGSTGGGGGAGLDAALSTLRTTPVDYCAGTNADRTAVGTFTVVLDGVQDGPYFVDWFGAAPTTTTLVACSPGPDPFPGIRLELRHAQHVRTGDPLGARVVAPPADNADFEIYLGDSRGAADVAHLSVSGTAEVTAFDYAGKHFAGTADVETDQASSLSVDWDVTFTN